MLADLPDEPDPLGENGEYHSCVIDVPMFSHTIAAEPGPVVQREIQPAASEVHRFGSPTCFYADIVLK